MQTVFNYSMWFYLIWHHSLYCLSRLTQAHFQHAAEHRGSKCQAHCSIYPEKLGAAAPSQNTAFQNKPAPLRGTNTDSSLPGKVPATVQV